jgi:hypothetical protein
MTEMAEQIEDDFEDQAEEINADMAEMADGNDDEAEEVVISINGEAPAPEEDEEARAPDWVRDLRKNYREEKRRSKELEQRLAQVEQRNTQAVAPLGQKPTLEKADYDTDRYEKDLTAWYEKKRQHDEREATVKSEHQAVQKEWESKLESYQGAKAGLKVRDFEFAEDVEGGVAQSERFAQSARVQVDVVRHGVKEWRLRGARGVRRWECAPAASSRGGAR